MNGTWLDRNRHIVFVILVIITLGGATAFYLWRPAQTPVEIVSAETLPTPLPDPTPIPTPAPVRVYVTGAVMDSDVYFLPQGSIVKDAILAAGGLTADADRERINQALELRDQQQIHVPRIGEENLPSPVQDGLSNNGDGSNSNGSSPVSASPINLNTASLEELDSLPGIGPAIAGRIIDYRENHGGFKTVEEITEVSGIGQATLAKIKDIVTVE
jgi:competence protein ComEA